MRIPLYSLVDVYFKISITDGERAEAVALVAVTYPSHAEVWLADEATAVPLPSLKIRCRE